MIIDFRYSREIQALKKPQSLKENILKSSIVEVSSDVLVLESEEIIVKVRGRSGIERFPMKRVRFIMMKHDEMMTGC